jgi:small nuclear ribonucleoprotein (snRNP)-like protein
MPKRSSNSLVALLHALQGRKLIFELRNDVKISGKLSQCDEYMNMLIDDAVWQPLQGPATPYPFIFIKVRNLRMVHLPRNLDPVMLLEKHIEQMKKQRVAAALDVINKRHERMAKGSSSAAAAYEAGEGAAAASQGQQLSGADDLGEEEEG